jgi:hypothetical protein
MEMVGKQSFPFMELFGQLCLTVWATVSYCLGNCVLLLVEMVERRSQLETERADRDRCRTFWLEGKNCIGSGKNNFPA